MNKRYFLLFLVPPLLLALIYGISWWHRDHEESPALDKIIETMHIADIYKYLEKNEYNKNTLVIFDIDNTLIAPKTDLGSDQWFDALYDKKMEEKNISKNEAIKEILPIYKQVLIQTDYFLVEPETACIIKKLQNKGVTVIALTARSLDLAYRTVEQLQDVGINFDKNQHACPIVYGDGKPALYLDGIIFSGNYNKGEVLVAWLQQLNYTPHKVIFIDDKIKNIRSVEKAIHQHGFPFYGLRYGYLDKQRKNFDWDKTQKKLERFLKKYPESRPIPA